MCSFEPVFPLILVVLLTVMPGCAWADLLSTPLLGTSFLPPPIAGARPAQPVATADPALQCRAAVASAGRSAGIPDHLMSAIARVESGRRAADGQIQPWPWSINVEGTDHIYDTRDQAIAAVRGYQAQGIRSIDVGCMQVNLLHHPNAFASLEQAFDPTGNAIYAAHFLRQLFDQTGSWPKATAAYHSATPELGSAYQQKVASVLGDETTKDNELLGHSPVMARSTGGGAIMLGNRAEAAHIIPLANPGNARGLAAYRLAPVRVAASGG
jgi:hypothetical protein